MDKGEALDCRRGIQSHYLIRGKERRKTEVGGRMHVFQRHKWRPHIGGSSPNTRSVYLEKQTTGIKTYNLLYGSFPTVVQNMVEGAPHRILGASQGIKECLIQRHCHQPPWWWCIYHIEVDEACDGVMWASLSANATKPYPEPGTCVEPDAGHVAACI